METKTSNWIKTSISLKLIVLVSLSLLLLIPSFMVKQLIKERQNRRNETISEVTQKWGQYQEVSGPVLVIPFLERVYNGNNQYKYVRKHFRMLPTKLDIDGTIAPEIRYRGIYKVICYRAKLRINGEFKAEDFKEWPDEYHEILWNEAKLETGLTDLRGVKDNILLNWNDTTVKFRPGSDDNYIFRDGIHTSVMIKPEKDNKFSYNLEFNGSESLMFIPAGKTTEVKLTSDWDTPSFDGAFLPDPREVNEDGFNAKWKILEMNRSLPQKWLSMPYNQYTDNSAFGVRLILPVDNYQKAMRSVKYALLFIALTFLVIFFSEILGKIRVHPIQYLITGSALIVFFSLLIALAEHITYNLAYLISSLVIISMITLYVRSIFRSIRITAIVTSILIGLYVFLFTILQIADYSLLLGNIGLILVIGAVMFFSSKIDWYQSKNTANNTEN